MFSLQSCYVPSSTLHFFHSSSPASLSNSTYRFKPMSTYRFKPMSNSLASASSSFIPNISKCSLLPSSLTKLTPAPNPSPSTPSNFKIYAQDPYIPPKDTTWDDAALTSYSSSATTTATTAISLSTVPVPTSVPRYPPSILADHEDHNPVDPLWADLRSFIPHSILRKIQKPARYLGNERGAVHKPWHTAQARMCLAYPEMYEVGFSNTGHVILYSCVNEVENVLCDRAYLPAKDMADILKDLDLPLFAVESKKPLNHFDILGIPIHYELGATNCLELLHQSRVPLSWKERQDQEPGHIFSVEDGSPPLVFAGGGTATANPEPFADFFDFVSLGDGEIVLPEIARVVAKAKKEKLSREEILCRLAQIPGIYVPKFYDRLPDGSVRRNRPDVPLKPKRQVANPEPERALALVPLIETIHDRLVVEIRRGCTRGCRFCQPGNMNRPARDVEPERVINAVVDGVIKSGYREFSLLSLSCSDYLSLPAVGIELKNRLAEHNINLSLPSQRVDRFDNNIADIQGGLRKSGMTFAPEAGTQRMRDVINKGLTNEDLLRGVKTAYDRGWSQVKLYFMIGLPGETDDDVVGIAETVKWLQRECKGKGRRPLAVNVTISNFTPKPHTPFQWHSVSTSEFVRKQNLLKREFYNTRDVKVNYTDVRISAMEDFVGRGDRRLSSVIRRAWELGASMDAWWLNLDGAYEAWTKAIHESGLSWAYRKTEVGEWDIMKTPREDVLGKRGWYDVAKKENLDFKTLTPKVGWADTETRKESDSDDPDETTSSGGSTSSHNDRGGFLDRPLPWDHIDSGLEKGWQRDELMRALSETLTPDCSFSDCSSCGVCGDDMGHNIVIEPPPIPKYKGITRQPTNRIQRLRICLSKYGTASLISNLDLFRIFDRAVLRAGIPLSFSEGFHPQPRFNIAFALPLGMTSDCEYIDFDLSEKMEPNEFHRKLQEQLPPGIHIKRVDDARVDMPNRLKLVRYARSTEWALALEYVRHDNENDNANEKVPPTEEEWQGWVKQILESKYVLLEKMTKRKQVQVKLDVRRRLLGLRMADPKECEPVLLHCGPENWTDNIKIVTYEGVCDVEGHLSPENVLAMFEEVTSKQFILRHAHRLNMSLADDAEMK